MTILLHYDKSLLLPRDDIVVKCIAYAPPPLFYPLETAQEAVNNTTAYVHEYDVVPSLSCNALRRLLKAVISYDNEKLSTYERVRIEYGYDEPPERLSRKYVKPATPPCQNRTEHRGWPFRQSLLCGWRTHHNDKERIYATVLLDPV